MGKRNSFIFYRSFFESIEKLKNKDKLTLYSHLCKYALGEEVGNLDGVPAAIFDLIKPQIDANTKRYEGGLKGGRPVTKPKPKDNLSETITKPNVNENYNENLNVNVNANANDNSNPSGSDDSAGQSGTNTTPSFKEVADEVAEKGFKISAVKFYEYYEKNGWKTNEGEPIRDWKKMLAVWNMKERFGVDAASGKAKPKKNAFNSFEQREYSNGDLEAMLLQKGDN